MPEAVYADFNRSTSVGQESTLTFWAIDPVGYLPLDARSQSIFSAIALSRSLWVRSTILAVNVKIQVYVCSKNDYREDKK